MLVHSMFLALLLVAAVYDLWRLRIPNPVSAGLVVLVLMAALPGLLETAWLGHLGAGGLMLVLGALLFRFRLMGGGDVKLLAATSLWVGFDLLLYHLFFTALIGVGLLLVLSVLRRLLRPALVAVPPGHAWMPRFLESGKAVPYGVAIAISAAGLGNHLPSGLWTL